jgi:hypothetical protein
MSKALIIGTVWAEKNASAAGVRMWRLIDTLQHGGYAVTFGSASQNLSARAALEEAGIPTMDTPVNDGAFNANLRALQPSLVVFDRFMTEEQFSWRVRQEMPDAIRVLDTIDLHFLRLARQKNPADPDLGPENETLLRELAAMYRSDVSLVLSTAEHALLLEKFGVPERKLCYHPLVYPAPECVAPGYAERSHFCTIGNFRHPPNADAVDRLRTTLWPAIRARIPRAELHIFGAYPVAHSGVSSKKVNGLRVVGETDDLKGMMHQHRVLLAPLRFGAGLKGKIMDAWHFGMPVVTTAIGAEGLFPSQADWGGAIADDDAALVDAAVALYGDGERWKCCVDRGRAILKEHFSVEPHSDHLLETISSIDREQDVWAAMLWREQVRGTEYMSRWIELKNR